MRGATLNAVTKYDPRKFQPTRPLRGATVEGQEETFLEDISTHAPLAGRDRSEQEVKHIVAEISTHAPLAGRDV